MIMCKTTIALGQLMGSVYMEESYLGKTGYSVLYKGIPPLEVPPQEQKSHMNSYRCKTVHQGKVDPSGQ